MLLVILILVALAVVIGLLLLVNHGVIKSKVVESFEAHNKKLDELFKVVGYHPPTATSAARPATPDAAGTSSATLLPVK